MPYTYPAPIVMKLFGCETVNGVTDIRLGNQKEGGDNYESYTERATG